MACPHPANAVLLAMDKTLVHKIHKVEFGGTFVAQE